MHPEPNSESSPDTRPVRGQVGFQYLTYAYLLRFPLLTALVLVVLPFISLFTEASDLLENLFDLGPGGIFLVTLAAVLAAWSVMVSWRLVLLYSEPRFAITPPSPKRPFRWKHNLLFALLALPTVGGIVYETLMARRANNGEGDLLKLLAVIPGFLTAVASLWAAQWLQRRLNRPATNRQATALLIPEDHPLSNLTQTASEAAPVMVPPNWLARRLREIPPFFGSGYIDYDANLTTRFPLLPGHGLAIGLMLSYLVVYAFIGALTSPWLTSLRNPSLGGILLLLTMINWGLSALSYFFDRYRIPVSAVIGLWLFVSSIVFQRADNYFQVHPKAQAAAQIPLPPERVIQPIDANAKIILVAANGGGIQAAGWTARVLTGLEQACRQTPQCAPHGFSRSIRMLSAVSGGSVGAMYFANAYDSNGNLPADAAQLENIVTLAERSSLDAVAWGLVYPDFLRLAVPVFSELPFFWRTDRGRTLELEWKRDVPLDARLSDWRLDVAHNRRPAMVFNTTIADTGQPLLFSTVDHMIKQSRARTFDTLPGVADFDVPVVTAVRLSATFPYVTPAARADAGGPGAPQYHIVDGGYYDNYGTATLVEWLDAALEQCGNEITEVLVIRIHSMPSAADKPPADKRGSFYQAAVPITTLGHVRTAGQLSHSRMELDLLRKRWRERPDHRVNIELATFEYQATGCTEGDPPLSWHLTARQKQNIGCGWQKMTASQDPDSDFHRVQRFLSR